MILIMLILMDQPIYGLDFHLFFQLTKTVFATSCNG